MPEGGRASGWQSCQNKGAPAGQLHLPLDRHAAACYSLLPGLAVLPCTAHRPGTCFPGLATDPGCEPPGLNPRLAHHSPPGPYHPPPHPPCPSLPAVQGAAPGTRHHQTVQVRGAWVSRPHLKCSFLFVAKTGSGDGGSDAAPPATHTLGPPAARVLNMAALPDSRPLPPWHAQRITPELSASADCCCSKLVCLLCAATYCLGPLLKPTPPRPLLLPAGAESERSAIEATVRQQAEQTSGRSIAWCAAGCHMLHSALAMHAARGAFFASALLLPDLLQSPAPSPAQKPSALPLASSQPSKPVHSCCHP